MKLLCVFAHPDDEILACGGITALYVRRGWEVKTVILGEDRGLKELTIKANAVIGVKDVIFPINLPDNSFDSMHLLCMCKCIEEIIKEYNPNTIFTHYRNDLNVDHRMTYQAVLTACRPMRSHVKEIYSFPVLSSTEYQYPQTFSPTVYFDILNGLALKVHALEEYKDEILQYPCPRSIEGVLASAHFWGMQVNLAAVEPAELIRMIK